MPDAIELLQRIIADSKRGSEIPNIAELTDDDYIFVFVPGSGFRKVKKGDIVFPGEPISKLTELSDTPSQTLGQAGKILIVNETEDGFVYRAINDVEGVTQQELNDALANYIKTISVNGGTAQSPDENGNVNLTVSTESGSFEGYQIIDLGDILTATIEDEFNDDALASPIVIDKGTIIKAIQNDEAKQWFFVGTPATYDGSATLAVASDFYSFVSREEMEAALAEYADKRLSNIVSDLSEAEKTAIKNKLGVVEGGGGTSNISAGAFTGELNVSGGNRYYDDYDSGTQLGELSLSSTKVLGSQARVNIKGDLMGTIPSTWRKSGQPFTNNPAKWNELTLLYVKPYDVNVVNRVFDILDISAPSTPTGLTSSQTSANSTRLDWNAATDNIEVVSYKVYQDGVEVAEVTSLFYTVTGLTADTSFSFTVTALDEAGNESDPTAPEVVQTAQEISYTAEYQSMLDYADANGFVKPNETQRTFDNQKIVDLKAEGVWDALDWLYYDAVDYTPTSYESNFYRLNWKNPGTFTRTSPTGSEPSFVSGSGFKVQGSDNKYMKTGYIPSTHGVNFSEENGSLIIGMFDIPTPFAGVTYWFGGRSGGNAEQILIGNSANGNLMARLVESNEDFAITQAEINGHYHIITSANSIKVYKDGALLGENASADSALENTVEQYLLGYNNNGNLGATAQPTGVKYAAMGSSLEAKQGVVHQIMTNTY